MARALSILDRYHDWQRRHIALTPLELDEMKTLEKIRFYIRSLDPLKKSLQFQCRRVIRQQMSIAADGKSILDGIDDLPLPVFLIGYLKFKDADYSSWNGLAAAEMT